MAVLTGITGSVTSWAGSAFNGSLLTGSRPAQFTLNMTGEDIDTTAFADSGIQTHIKGLSSWAGQFTAQLAEPAIGNLGLVTFSAGYTTNLNAWSIQANQQSVGPVTAFAGTEHAYIPGTIDWGGTFSGFIDGTTALTAVGNSSEPASATFKFAEKGATDNTLSGSIFTTALNATVQPTAANAVSYSFRGSGALTQSSPSAGTPIFTAGALPLTAATSLVLTCSTGRTMTGSAFWTSISINCAVAQAVTVTVGFQGTGALAIA